jgi:glycerol-3-phosphate dehydrogenase subunit C
VARGDKPGGAVKATPETSGKVALFTTCYCNRNEPDIDDDLARYSGTTAFRSRSIPQERAAACRSSNSATSSPSRRRRSVNIPALAALVDQGYDIVAPIPSCVLMFKQELPLLFPDDPQVQKVRAAMFDPFEYLMLRHKAGLLRTDFRASSARSAITCRATCACRTWGSRPATC